MNNPISSICSDAQTEQLEKYMRLLIAQNDKVNLVSRKDVANLWLHHIEPCLAFFALKRITPGEHIVDIGSGGGLPAIVNAIMFPDVEFVCIDSTQKKVNALTEMITELQLRNIQAVWSRVEQVLVTHPNWEHYFDRATCRAVAPLAQLAAWAEPLVKAGGTVEALKGGDITAERAASPYPVSRYKLPDELETNERLQSLVIATVQLPG